MTWKKTAMVGAGALVVFLLWYFLKGKKAHALPLGVPDGFKKLPAPPTGGDVGDYKAPGEDKLKGDPEGEVFFGTPGSEEFSELKITR